MIEKFLAVLAALVTAIDNNTAALNKAASAQPAPEPAKKTKAEKAPAPAPAQAAETPAPAQTPAPTPAPAAPTIADVRSAAQALLDANGNDGTALTELNKKYGTKRISEVPPEKYAEVIAALKDLTEKAKAGANAGI